MPRCAFPPGLHHDMAGRMPTSSRDRTLTIAAVLFGVLAVSNLLKPLQLGGDQTGFVFLGARQTGSANTVLGVVFGLYLAVYAYGIWTMRRWALPMAWAYAAYVAINLVLFPFRTPPPPGAGLGWQVFGIVYAAVALGVTIGTARLLARRRPALA
jgi:hypothetical protein